MIVVIPNGRALADDSATGNQFAPEKVEGFARFEQDLLGRTYRWSGSSARTGAPR